MRKVKTYLSTSGFPDFTSYFRPLTANFSCLLLISIFIVSCNSNQSNPNSGRILKSYFSENVVIGSHTTDWSGADFIYFADTALSDNEMIVRTLWNRDSIYFRFEVRDYDLRAYQTEKDHPKLYLDDMVEILIDPNNDKDCCWTVDDIVYHINILGLKKDDRGTADCQSDPIWDGHAAYTIELSGTVNNSSDNDSGYIVEMSIPWTELGLVPKKGLKMGINFANGDNDGNGRQLYDWCGAHPMRSPQVFGTIILSQK